MTPLLLLALLAAPARAQAVDRETFTFLGWNKACSAAVAHLGYPVLGEAIADEPVMTRIGTLTIAPGAEEAKAEWLCDWDGRRSWDAEEAHAARRRLSERGYILPGFVEAVRARVAPERDLPRLILSTDTFRTKSPGPFPGPGWRLERVYYSPLASTCAVLVFRDERAAKDRFRALLARVGNPAIRFDRAVSRVTNARLLQEKGFLPDALREAADAAALAPERAEARYHHAALLHLSGKLEEAVAELERAVELDKGLSRKARGDKDFRGLSWHPRFRRAAGLPPED